MRQGRKQLSLALLTPGVTRYPKITHLDISRTQGGPEPRLLILVQKAHFNSEEAMQGVAVVRHVAQDDLTLLARLLGLQDAHLSQGDPVIASKSRVVGAHSGRLYAQCEAPEAVVVDLKWLAIGLS